MFKRLFWRACFRRSLFSEGLIIGRNFAFQNGLDLTIKTASTNSPWAYLREGLLSEGYLRLRFAWGAYFRGGLIIGILRYSGELIFGRAYYWREFCVLKSVELDNKNSLKHEENSLKQLKTGITKSPWAYIQEDFLSQGYLRLRFFFLFFLGGGGLLSEVYGIAITSYSLQEKQDSPRLESFISKHSF